MRATSRDVTPRLCIFFKCLATVPEQMGGYTKNTGGEKMNPNQKHSYLDNPPATGVACLAGGDSQHPKSFIADWTTVEVSELLLEVFLPACLQQRKAVMDEVESARQKVARGQASLPGPRRNKFVDIAHQEGPAVCSSSSS